MNLRTEISCPRCWSILDVSRWKAALVGAAVGFVVLIAVLFRFNAQLFGAAAPAHTYYYGSPVRLFFLPLVFAYAFAGMFPRISEQKDPEP